MSQTALKREIKKAIDQLPPDRLQSVADYVAFLNRPNLKERIEKAERDLKAGKGIDWRKVRDDV
jgi:hypothetical protein